MTLARAARTLRFAPFALTLLVLGGCGILNTGNATQQGKNAAGQAGQKAKDAGQSAEHFANSNPHLAAALIVAILGAVGIKFLWKSAQVKYLVFLAAGLWVGYAIWATH